MTLITKEEIDNILTAMKSGNWAYVIRVIPRMKHAEQFMLLNAIPIGYLQDFHRNIHGHMQYLQQEYYETQYACDTSVTILRSRGRYGDQKQDDDIKELQTVMNESIRRVLWEAKE
jgi:hypothetical protein